MKTKFLVAVDYDDQEPGESFSDGNVMNDFTFHRVVIRNENEVVHSYDPVSVLAHELGHVIAKQLGLPGSNEMRKHIRAVQENSISARPALIQAEEEAWEIAEKMGVPISQADKEEALKTYHDPEMYRDGVKKGLRGEFVELDKITKEE